MKSVEQMETWPIILHVCILSYGLTQGCSHRLSEIYVDVLIKAGFETVRKKGEVVEPAGGETGVPHCLAEVRKLPEAALYC
jgi:hypothetical protein